MDNPSTLDSLKLKARAFRDARNWKQFHKPKDLAAALSIEAAELQELFLWKTHEECAAYLGTEVGQAKLREETADVMLFLLHLADVCDLDLAAAVEAKLALNEKKYPVAQSYNSHRKYTELKKDPNAGA